jgi:CRISPR-associated protein Csm5
MHIGNGRLLLNEHDYAYFGGRTWRINEAEFVDQFYDEVMNRGTGIPPAQFLKPADYVEESTLFRYFMKGAPRSTAAGAQLREQIKTTLDDEPYLPGTAVKGALRTALAWHGWEAERLRPAVTELNRRREFAAQRYEQQLFGPNPNRDLLRALLVGDSQPAARTQLMVANISVMTGGGKPGSPIEVEAIRPETAFKFDVKIDRALFSDWARRQGLQLKHEDWLTELVQITHAHAQSRIAAELAWCERARNCEGPSGAYRQLKDAATQARPNQCLVQLGWGTGWGSKTFGERLQVDGDFMERILSDYRMARGHRQAGDRFPKSRRLVMKANPPDAPSMPMGWAWLTFKKSG